MNKILIIVDFQKDFCEKTGSLYVPGAEIAKENILKYLDTEKPDAVCFTLDWHTRHDESFKRNGGIWPDHCIQYSEGAALDQDILRKCIDNNILYTTFLKGDGKVEEYGAFGYGPDRRTPMGVDDVDDNDEFLTLVNYNGRSRFTFHKDNEYVICGLAGDYCVKATYDNLKKYGINVTPFYEGIAFIGEPFKY